VGECLRIAAVVVLFAGCGKAPNPPVNKCLGKVGELIIDGNTVTPDSYIREHLNLYPGQKLWLTDWLSADQRLARAGINATVAFDDFHAEDELYNVRIRVRESPFTRLVFARDKSE
jgi:hypothetical protein